jgi:hypothetical protein
MWSEGRAGERGQVEEQQQEEEEQEEWGTRIGEPPPQGGGAGGAREVREGNGRRNLGGGRAQREWEGHGESMGEESYELPRLGPCPNYNAISLGSGLVRALRPGTPPLIVIII